MASTLLSSEIETWYARLNRARQLVAGLGAITQPPAAQTQTQKRVMDLVSNIGASQAASPEFLGLADNDIDPSNITVGSPILESDRQAIDHTIISMLRICNNKNCETVCNNTGTNSNTAQSNGTYSNGANANGVNANGASHGTYNNGTCWNGQNYVSSNGSDGYYNSNYDGTCQDGTCSNGCANSTYSNVTKSNVAHNNGTRTNGVNTNGCTDQIYDPATATYAARNYYTEEQAMKR